MGDDQIVISGGQAITPESVVSRSFTSAFRGYHPVEVREYLKRVSDELVAGAEREAELRRNLQEAVARAAHPELDEATVTQILGEHAARLLASARDTAATIVEEARQQAGATLRDAEGRTARMREEGEGLMARRVAEADAAAESIRHAAQAEAAAEIERATNQGKEMVAEARAVRERMLADLARRRRSAQVQIEQLRAVRERLMAAYDVVRRTVDEATAELEAAEPEARRAAEAVARRADDFDVPEPVLPSVPARTTAPREPAVPTFRRMAPEPPPAPERPPLRPQTVASAVGRLPLPQIALPEPLDLPPAPPPAPGAEAPPVEAPPAPAPAPLSELATGEVPVVTGERPAGGVEELFARLRADRPPTAPPDAAPSVVDSQPVQAPPPPAAPAPAVDAVVGEHALEGRDDLLDNLEAGLTRALKRVLGDEQNEVLDGLRRLGPAAGPAGVLPALDAQLAAYRDAALPWLQQAARAGVGFVSDPAAGTEEQISSPPCDAEAELLARDLVDPLRERLSRALADAADADDPSTVAETLRATYRQWKVQQVEEAARHHVVAAFSEGAFAATPDVASLLWLVDDDGHCPDCDDNALAGPTAKGEPFPTGQLHPPAHPGCRCLLVSVTG